MYILVVNVMPVLLNTVTIRSFANGAWREPPTSHLKITIVLAVMKVIPLDLENTLLTYGVLMRWHV